MFTFRPTIESPMKLRCATLLPLKIKDDFISADGPTVTFESSHTPPRRYAKAATKQFCPTMQGALRTAPSSMVAVSCAAIPCPIVLYDDGRSANRDSTNSTALAQASQGDRFGPSRGSDKT